MYIQNSILILLKSSFRDIDFILLEILIEVYAHKL